MVIFLAQAYVKQKAQFWLAKMTQSSLKAYEMFMDSVIFAKFLYLLQSGLLCMCVVALVKKHLSSQHSPSVLDKHLLFSF